MNDMQDALEEVMTNHNVLDEDYRYLAWCYVNHDTNFELPMHNVIDEVSCDFSQLMRGVKRHITEIDPKCVIDDVLLMSYLDYYYQFVKISGGNVE